MISGPEIRLRILERININKEPHVVLEEAETLERWVRAAQPLSDEPAPQVAPPVPKKTARA